MRLCILTIDNINYVECDWGCVILHVWEVLPCRMLLEGQDGQTHKDHVCNHALCHLPNVDGQIDPSLVVVLIDLQCIMCGQFLGATTKLICWLVFLMLAYGMLDGAIKENTSEKMVLFSMHQIDLGTYFNG